MKLIAIKNCINIFSSIFAILCPWRWKCWSTLCSVHNMQSILTVDEVKSVLRHEIVVAHCLLSNIQRSIKYFDLFRWKSIKLAMEIYGEKFETIFPCDRKNWKGILKCNTMMQNYYKSTFRIQSFNEEFSRRLYIWWTEQVEQLQVKLTNTNIKMGK